MKKKSWIMNKSGRSLKEKTGRLADYEPGGDKTSLVYQTIGTSVSASGEA